MTWTIESVREAAVTPSEIFRFYTDPSTWGRWGHNTRWGRLDGPFVEGAVVDVKAGYGRVWPVLVRRVVPDRYVECEVRPPGMVVVNSYEVEPAARGCRLRHAITVSGPAAGFNRILLSRLYTRLLEKETRRLVELASQ